MGQTSLLPLGSWMNFYVIVGSSAGALTSVQFVVITLIAQTNAGGSMQEIRAFGTPTVVHFCVALLISGLMTAPWHELWGAGYCIGACAIAGLAYSIRVVWHAKKAEYAPDAEDWIWYTALPIVAYTSLLTAAVLVWFFPAASLFMIAAATLIFLFAGIHNAWDTVTYVAIQRRPKPKDSGGST